jgi:hypothetical protein
MPENIYPKLCGFLIGGFEHARNGGFYFTVQTQGDIVLFSSSTVCKERIVQFV